MTTILTVTIASTMGLTWFCTVVARWGALAANNRHAVAEEQMTLADLRCCCICIQVLTGQCFSQRDVAALARGGQLSSVQDAGLLRAAEDRLRDQAREMYRACWNIPSRRRVLAHLPSLMIWGPQEVFHSDNETVKRLHRPEDVGSEHKENNGADNTSKTSDIINRVCRDVYWEYQRQLWAPGFAGKGGTDEFHFHRYGRVGLLFIDILGFRLGPRGRNDMTRAVVGPRQLRFLNEAVLADATLMTLVVVAPCAPKMLPAALIQPMMQWRNRPPVPSPKDFARQLLFVGGGRRARQARVGMFVSTPPAEVSPPDVLSEASQKRDQHLGGTAFMLSTGSVAGRPGEISFGVIHAHANLHSSWIERWVEPARSEQAKGVVTVGPVVGSLSSTAAVVLFEADKSAPSARVVLIDVVAGTQHTSSASALEANRPKVRAQPVMDNTLSRHSLLWAMNLTLKYCSLFVRFPETVFSRAGAEAWQALHRLS